ncbi:hypothetical protein BS50DRAFT_673443 [Corynespora cassiicola Philippines]|uniref:Integral membrane protein n=1 Tax=Corynespora cassiicola Philippines TaxID=1448308 RepID=A0A2T2NZ29_CORCC|nr:hypothetical protein BS50DRAFT_673443 [Corynespora cassiicola Philippines]
MLTNAVFLAISTLLLLFLWLLALLFIYSKWCLKRFWDFDASLVVGMVVGMASHVLVIIAAAREKRSAGLFQSRANSELVLVFEALYAIALALSKLTLILALRRIFSLRSLYFVVPTMAPIVGSLCLAFSAILSVCHPYMSPANGCNKRAAWPGLWASFGALDIGYETALLIVIVILSRRAYEDHRSIIQFSFGLRLLNLIPATARIYLVYKASTLLGLILATQLSLNISLFSCLGTSRNALLQPFGFITLCAHKKKNRDSWVAFP